MAQAKTATKAASAKTATPKPSASKVATTKATATKPATSKVTATKAPATKATIAKPKSAATKPKPAAAKAKPAAGKKPAAKKPASTTKVALKKGDKVTWDASQGPVEGTVQSIVTGTKKVKGHTAKATKENPEVEVKSTKTGKTAIHKPKELKKK